MRTPSSSARPLAAPWSVTTPEELERGKVRLVDPDSVINVTQVATIDRDDLIELVRTLPGATCDEVDAGLRLVLAL